jgi:hypothetical protein
VPDEPTLDTRSAILDGVRDVLAAGFGPSATVEADRILRAVTLGPWTGHDGTNLPKATVIDGGQARDTSRQVEGGDYLKLRVRIILDLQDNWDREATMPKWSAVVQRMIASTALLSVTNVAIEVVDYVEDNPWEFIIGSASALADWVIEIEVTYFEGYGSE